MYYDIDLRRKRAELGIMIGDRQYWGKGYGTDAVKTLLFHVFTKTEIDFIYLHTLEWNQRARRAFEKAGLREVKKVRRGGLDFIEMEISRIDWEQKGLSDTGAPGTGTHRVSGH
jgi:RimJ/RimL family protein N-acetyltransferase